MIELSQITLEMGHLKTVVAYCLMTGGFIVALCIAGFILLTTDNGIMREVSEALDGRKIKIPRPIGAAVFMPTAILACLWIFQSNLGSRFDRLHGQSDGKVITWQFESRAPNRTFSVSENEIKSWSSQIDWTGRTPKRILVVNLDSGAHLRSISDNDISHKETIEKLGEWGVEVD
jgi:hypothetical protein